MHLQHMLCIMLVYYLSLKLCKCFKLTNSSDYSQTAALQQTAAGLSICVEVCSEFYHCVLESLYLMHGVQQLGELVETLPVLAGVLLTLHNGFAQLLDVRHPNLIKHCLALQAVLWHCGGGQTQCQHGTGRYKAQQIVVYFHT